MIETLLQLRIRILQRDTVDGERACSSSEIESVRVGGSSDEEQLGERGGSGSGADESGDGIAARKRLRGGGIHREPHCRRSHYRFEREREIDQCTTQSTSVEGRKRNMMESRDFHLFVVSSSNFFRFLCH